MKISGRNRLAGAIEDVRRDGISAQVTIAVDPGRVVAVITADAATELGLQAGDRVEALIKASDVMVLK